MVIDNFDKIKTILKWDTSDDFYHVMIMQRPKETGVQRIIKQFIIKEGDLDSLKDRIIEYCRQYNARAYINPNRKSFHNTTLKTIQELTTCILNNNYNSVQDKFFSACGQIGSNYQKIWVIDIDSKDRNLITEVRDFVNGLMPNPGEDKILMEIETKNGIHLLSSPFNIASFNDKYKIDVHKNNFTLLYFEWKDLNEMAKNGDRLEVVKIIHDKSNIGLKNTADIIRYYVDNNLDIYNLKDQESIHSAYLQMKKSLIEYDNEGLNEIING